MSYLLQEIDGVKFMDLSKQDIMSLVNNKMGPCLKLEHLQKMLKVSFGEENWYHWR